MAIQLKRQGSANATSCSSAALKPTSLSYGEPAVDSDGYIYVGNGKGQVVSLVRAADRAAVASTATVCLTSDSKGTPFLYQATFRLSNWSGSGPYTQSAALTARDGGPDITASSKFASGPMCDQTNNQETNEILQEVLEIINNGYLTLSANTLSARVWEKPTADITIVVALKQG